ncbi:MAG: hypothetical protein GKS07_08755 [Nitrosopumilus sp.]|nr:MAG: hypothetical protein GKS07_08755 [Nitrosopumilus sp.]
MIIVLERNEIVHTAHAVLFNDLQNSEKYSSYFKNTFLSITGKEQIPNHFQFVANISNAKKLSNAKESSFIHGTINSAIADDNFQELNFKWTLNPMDENKTEINYKIYNKNAQVIQSAPVINPLYDVKTMTLIGSTTVGIATMAVIPTTMIASSATGMSGVLISKSILVAIIISVAAVTSGAGIIMNDTYFDEPYMSYNIYPKQLPAELHGTELTIIKFILSDGSTASSYKCKHDQIIYSLEYSFDCTTTTFFGNPQVVSTTVEIMPSRNFLGAEAMDCISRHDVLSNDVTDESIHTC